jgi:hypothetical protein
MVKPLLSARTMASLRKVAEGFMVDPCTIQKPTEAATGLQTGAYEDVSYPFGKCAVETPGPEGQAYIMEIASSRRIKTPAGRGRFIHLNWEADIHEGYRIVVGTNIYEALRADSDDTQPAEIVVAAYLIKGQDS